MGTNWRRLVSGVIALGWLLPALTQAADQQFTIAVGATVARGVPAPGAGEIEAPGDTDSYSFVGTAGQRLFFDELSGHGCTGTLRWQLTAPDGQTLFEQRLAALDACGSGPDAGLITLPVDGTYRLRVYAPNNWVEAYSFRVVPVVDREFALNLGTSVTNTLPSPGGTDRYTFVGVAGRRVFFDELTGHGCFGTLRWRLTAPDGQTLFDERFAALDACGSGPDAGTVVLPQDGAYLLRVYAPNDWVETYAFRAVEVQDRTMALTLGTSVTNALLTPGGTDRYSFMGVAGQRVFFDELTGHGCFGTLRWRLAAPDGQTLFDERFAALDACGSGPDAGTVVLPQDGAYLLRVYAPNDWVETYAFRAVEVLDRTMALTLGTSVTNALLTPGGTDRYTFAGAAGQRVFFDELTGHGCFGTLRWRLTAPDGQTLFDERFAALNACGSGPDAGTVALPQDGAYLLSVYAPNDWVESYAFRAITVVDRAFVLTLGANITNTLATPGGTDRYTFAGAAGRRLFFDELTGHGCFGTLRWRLTAPDGQTLFDERFAALNACGSGPDAGIVALPEDGTYGLTVYAPNDWVETYAFQVFPTASPAIPPIGDRLVHDGELLTFVLAATPVSPQGYPLRFELLSGPPGATLDPDSGAFAWQAPVGSSGQFPVTWRVRDALGEEAQASFGIRVLFAPDLTIESLTVPPGGETEGWIPVSSRETNVGSEPATGIWVQRYWLSADRGLDPADTLLGAYRFEGTLAPGQSVGRNFQAQLPAVPGQYYIIGQVDADEAISEASETNNLRVSDPLTVASAYTATVQPEVDRALSGAAITLRGQATRRTGVPAARVPVNVWIQVRGTSRVLEVVTDDAGGFSTVFHPLPGEAGLYTVGAVHPGQADPPAQATFQLLGMSLNPRTAEVRLNATTNATFTATLVNRSQVALGGLQARVLELPAPPTDFKIEVEAAGTVPADGELPVTVRVSSLADVGLDGIYTVELSSTDGPRAAFALHVVIEPLQSRLRFTPSPLTAGMLRGAQTVLQGEVRNEGGLTSGPVSLLLPAVPWLSVASPQPLPSLAPGAAVPVTVLLQPAADLALGEHRGSLVVTDGASGTTVPFVFTAISAARADLAVEVVDELTFYGEGSPRVSGATVILRERGASTELARRLTSSDRRSEFQDLREGYYDLEVSAPNHGTFRGTTLVRAGVANEVQPFLTRETVRYEFTVVPATIEDRTRIRIETVFETFVPLPVITIEPNQIDVAELDADRSEVELKITNHGLIAAQDFRLNFTSSPGWHLTPLVNELGDLAARSSVVVPLIIERVGAQISLKTGAATAGDVGHRGNIRLAGGGGGDDCGLGGGGCYTLICGTNRNTYCVPVFFPFTCPSGGGAGPYLPPPIFGLGGGGSYTPPVCQCVPMNCDPCAGPTAQALFECLIGFLPIPDLAGCLKDTKGVMDALTDCYRSAQTNGPPCDLASGSVAAGSYFVSCAKALGKEVPYVGELLSAIDCYLKIKKAQEDCKGQGGGGKAGVRLAGDRRTLHNEIGSFLPGTQTVLQQGERLEALAGVFTVLFGDPAWLHPGQGTNFNAFLEGLAGTVALGSPGGYRVTVEERAALLRGALPDLVSSAQVNRFLDRWNRTLDYAPRGIYLSTEVPPGESADFIALDAFQAALNAAVGAVADNEAEGWGSADPLLGMRAAMARLREDLAGDAGGVCARVRLRLDQDAVVTREAFRARLELENNSEADLTDLDVVLEITDRNGQPAGALFGVLPPELDGLNAVDGTGVVLHGATGAASWMIVPGHEAAPSPDPAVYLVGGSFAFSQGTNTVRVPLVPAPITVHPTPRLSLTYFHERDVRADDPFTEAIEPSLPYSLAVMVRNHGFGPARDLRIISSQPQIIENEKGLLIDFNLLGTEVAGHTVTPSLTADFGELLPGGIKTARWLFTSTLQGQFIEYSATFQNDGPLSGLPELSTVDEVNIHELIHIVRAVDPVLGDDGAPDFLVNDLPDDEFLPDRLYSSDGRTNLVRVVTTGSFDGMPGDAGGEVQLTANTPGGWTYLRFSNPSNGRLQLVRVRRADGSEVRIGDNAWTTDRTFIAGGRRPRYEYRLHLFDDTAEGPTSYRLTFAPASAADVTPPTSGMIRLPEFSRSQIPVQWFGADNRGGSGVAYFDVFASVDDGTWVPWLEQTTLTGALYSGEPGKRYGFRVIAVDQAGNRETAPAGAQTSTQVSLGNLSPAFIAGGGSVANEGELVQLQVSARDGDTPPDGLLYRLAPGAPEGATMDGSTGLVTWPTGEAHGPGVYPFTVIVTDTGEPPLSATNTVQLTVREVNAAPELAPIPDQVVREGDTVRLQAQAYDSDVPANRLTFGLLPGAPVGAAIDPVSGWFTWQPQPAQIPGTNQITVSVTDDGAPPLNAAQSFTVATRRFEARLVVSAGRTDRRAGEAGDVLLGLDSGAEVTNLVFRVRAEQPGLDALVVEPLSPRVAALEAQPVTDALLVRVAATSQQPLQGQLDLVRLRFVASLQDHSSVVLLRVAEVSGLRTGGLRPLEGQGRTGRVVVIGREPVLEPGSQPHALVVFGHPGARYAIEYREAFRADAPWQSLIELPQQDQAQSIAPLLSADRAAFYRVVELVPAP